MDCLVSEDCVLFYVTMFYFASTLSSMIRSNLMATQSLIIVICAGMKIADGYAGSVSREHHDAVSWL